MNPVGPESLGVKKTINRRIRADRITRERDDPATLRDPARTGSSRVAKPKRPGGTSRTPFR